jgi:hypothetical protein
MPINRKKDRTKGGRNTDSFFTRGSVTPAIQATALAARKAAEEILANAKKEQEMQAKLKETLDGHDARDDERAEQAHEKAQARARALEAARLSDLRADEQDNDPNLNPQDAALEQALQSASARLMQRRGSMDSISSTSSDGSRLSDLGNDSPRSIQDFDNTDPGEFFSIDRKSPLGLDRFDDKLNGKGPSSSESINLGYRQRSSSMDLLASALAPDPTLNLEDASLEAALQRARARVESRRNAALPKTQGLEGAPEYAEGSLFQSDVGPEGGPVPQGNASEGEASPSMLSRFMALVSSAVVRFFGGSSKAQNTTMSVPVSKEERPDYHTMNSLYESSNNASDNLRVPNALYESFAKLRPNPLYQEPQASIGPAYAKMTAPTYENLQAAPIKPDPRVLGELEKSRAASPAPKAPNPPPRPAHLKPPMPAPADDVENAVGPDQKPAADVSVGELPKPRSPSFRI